MLGPVNHVPVNGMDEPTPEAPLLRSVRNALAALEQLAAAGRPLGVTELGRRIGLPPSSTHRLLATLVATGYAAPVTGTGRYRSGRALVRLGIRATPPPLLRDVARPVLAQLAEATGETAHLAVLDGLDVVAIDHVAARSRASGAEEHPVGSRMPPHATALGLALLAFRPDVVDALVGAGLRRLTTETIADPVALGRRLDEVRRRGYATNVRGWRDRTAGVAAPILMADGRVVGAVGLSGAAERLGRRAALTSLGPLAARGAREIAARLTGEGPAHPTAE